MTSQWKFIGEACALPTEDAPRGSNQWNALSASSPQKSTSTSTPNRSSRARGLLKNLSHYFTIERTTEDAHTEQFSVGDAVFIDPKAGKRVVGPQAVLIPTKALQSPTKKGKGKQKPDAREEIDDGLEENAMIGLIVDIFEDERERPMIKVHWLYRPTLALATWKEGALEQLDVKIDSRELFYATDPDCYSLANQTTRATPSKGRSLRRESKAQDILAASSILAHCPLSSSKPDAFFVQRSWNPSPEDDYSWLPDLDWEEVLNTGIRMGRWELKLGEIYELSDQEDIAEQKKTPKKKDKGKAKEKINEDPFAESDESSESEEEGSVARTESEQESEDEEQASEDDGLASPVVSEAEEELPTPRKRKLSTRSGPAADKRIKLSAAAQKRRDQLLQRRKDRIAAREARHGQKLQLPNHVVPRKDMTPFQHARAILHVGATPDQLPCREQEFTEIEAYLEDAVDEGTGSCIYIAGVPGTGKTATVRSVVQSLQQRVEQEELSPFKFIEINGMKLTEPNQAFPMLWEFISGQKATARHSLSLLESHFKTPSPGRETCVVLVDELDQLVTKKNDVIYNFFNWPNQPHSKLIVIAIANTMDLPERYFSSKIRSRLGSNRVNFVPYDHNQLQKILLSRMEGLEVIAPPACLFVAKTVGKITGDARRALDICRRAVETVEVENDNRKLQGLEPKLVMISDVQAVIKAMSSSGPCLWIQQASLHQKILLLALSRCVKKQGQDQIKFGDLIQWHLTFLHQTGIQPIPTHEQFFGMLSALAAMKLVTTESSKLDHYQRVKPDVRDEDLELVLKQDNKLKGYVK